LVSFYFGPKDKAQGAAHRFNTNDVQCCQGARSTARPPASFAALRALQPKNAPKKAPPVQQPAHH
jgi:hypothetical protein